MRTSANAEKIHINGKKIFVLLMWLYFSITARATLTIYPQLRSIQGCQFPYTLQAKQNGTSTWYTVPLYNAQVTNQNGSSVNTTMASFDCSGAIDLTITFSSTVTSAAVRPASLSITPTIVGNTISFTIPGPEKFYVDINGDHYNNCFNIIAQPLEVNPPAPGDPNVVYIPTGTYNTSAINLIAGQTLYIQGGAAVSSIGLNNNTKVLGRGFVYRASYDAFAAYYLDNVYIDGPIDLNHGWGGGGGCGLRCGQSTNITIRNTASFSSKKWGDGYDIFCSKNVTVDDVFIRTNDDAIAFYGGGKSGYTGNCEAITVTNSVLLPDLAQSFHIGVYGDQNIDTIIGDIVVANVDIDDWSRTTGRPVIYFTVGDRVRATNIKFSNVRTTGYMPASFYKSFIGMAIVYNGTYNYAPGRAIDNIYYTNCSYTGSNGSPSSSINGYDATRTTSYVFFNNLTINGTTIASPSAGNFNIGSYANNISFATSPTGLAATAGNAQVALRWSAFSGATSYNVKCATVSGGPYTNLASGVTTTSYTNTGLTNGTTYYYVVSAVNSVVESANSAEVSATPFVATLPPPAPTGLTAIAASATQIYLNWSASTGATSYNVKRATVSGGPYATVATGVTAISYTDTGLTNGITYYYVVSAVNVVGESANSSQVSAMITINRATGGTATASAENPPNETAAKAFDGLTSTKWFNNNLGITGWLQYQFSTGVAWAINRYDLSCANDVLGRDPKDWQFQGSHDGVTWTTLDTRTGQVFASRFQTIQYNLSNTTAYEYYRLNITANNGDPFGIQLSEMALY